MNIDQFRKQFPLHRGWIGQFHPVAVLFKTVDQPNQYQLKVDSTVMVLRSYLNVAIAANIGFILFGQPFAEFGCVVLIDNVDEIIV